MRIVDCAIDHTDLPIQALDSVIDGTEFHRSYVVSIVMTKQADHDTNIRGIYCTMHRRWAP